MTNLPEFIAGSFNFVWGCAGILVIAVFAYVLETRTAAADVRRLMVGVMISFGATALYTLYWTGFRLALYRSDPAAASFYMTNAPVAAAVTGGLGLAAAYMHVAPHLRFYLGRWARPIFFLGAGVIWVAYAFFVLI